MGKEELDYKYMEANDFVELEKKIKEFSRENIVRGQIDHGYIVSDRFEVLKAWCHVFYIKREISRESSGAPVDIPVEDEKDYLIKCAVCGSYFNYLKWARCSGKDRHGIEGIPTELKDKYNKIWGRK